MIKKLRRNFIIVAMLSVFAVLVVIVAAMNIANYINSDSEADTLLELLSENGGSFGRMTFDDQPPEKPDGDMPEPPDLPYPDGEDPTYFFDKNDNLKFGRNRFSDRNFLTAETPYETRFFSVILKENGSPATIDTGKIAAVTTDQALSMAMTLRESGSTKGYSGAYKYLVSETEQGTLYLFIDRTRALRSVKDFMIISLLVALGALAAVFILVFIFSGIVIKPMAESYQKQKSFITNAGHELKTPLAVINSCTEVIEMEQGESKWTKGITTQTERLGTLTKELVALARMDEGGAQLNFEEFSLSDAVSEILDPFELMAEQKGIAFSTDIQPDIMYKGDKNSISRLCSIMADNAVKYVPEDGSISFTLTKKNRRVIFSSENTADGIVKGAHPEFFDRFHRGDSSRSSDIPGYGIGLSMAQSIVTAHGGKIEAFSKDGKSLTITAKL